MLPRRGGSGLKNLVVSDQDARVKAAIFGVTGSDCFFLSTSFSLQETNYLLHILRSSLSHEFNISPTSESLR